VAAARLETELPGNASDAPGRALLTGQMTPQGENPGGAGRGIDCSPYSSLGESQNDGKLRCQGTSSTGRGSGATAEQQTTAVTVLKDSGQATQRRRRARLTLRSYPSWAPDAAVCVPAPRNGRRTNGRVLTNAILSRGGTDPSALR